MWSALGASSPPGRGRDLLAAGVRPVRCWASLRRLVARAVTIGLRGRVRAGRRRRGLAFSEVGRLHL
eukprot:3126541-Pyramimonas_sp.AAC.1